MEEVIKLNFELDDKVSQDDKQLIINTILHRLNENCSKINYNEFLKWQDAQVTNKPTGLLNEKEKRHNNR